MKMSLDLEMKIKTSKLLVYGATFNFKKSNLLCIFIIIIHFCMCIKPFKSYAT